MSIISACCRAFFFLLMNLSEATNAQATPNGTTPETSPTPRHDILEVNNYLVSGLASSKIDMWFEGDLSQFEPHESSVAKSTPESLAETIRRAKIAAIHGLTELPGQEVLVDVYIPLTRRTDHARFVAEIDSYRSFRACEEYCGTRG